MTFYGVIKLLSVLENMSIADEFDIRYVFPSSFGYIKILPHYPCDSLYSVLLSQTIYNLPKHSLTSPVSRCLRNMGLNSRAFAPAFGSGLPFTWITEDVSPPA